MNNKLISGILTSIFLSSSIPYSATSFNYKYRIKGNSYSPMDCATVYYYKEEMLNKYNDYLLTMDENSKKVYIIKNIDFFKLYDNVSVNNIAGIICVTIGEGRGMLLEGQFRKNECDSEVINEKYFILELFK